MRHNTPDNPNHRENISETEALSLEKALWDKADHLIEAFRKTTITSATQPDADCSMTETVISYAMGETDPEKRDEIRSHLMACPACWDLYFDARTAIAEAMEADDEPMEIPPGVAAAIADQEKTDFHKKTRRVIAAKSYMLNMATRCKQWIADKPWCFVQAFGTAAVAVCLIIWMALPGAAGRLEKMIDQSYQAGYFHQMNLAAGQYQLPWETPVAGYGFAGGSEPTDASRAFGAGLWTGRRMLQKTEATSPMPDFLTPIMGQNSYETKTWSDTQWNPYYQMGKWCFLIYAASHGNQCAPVSFWGDQMEIVKQLREVYTEAIHKGTESGGVVAASLTALASEFTELKEKNHKSTKKIAFEIRNLIVYLSSGISPGDKNETSSTRF